VIEVELHPAFVWDCDECGRENYERAIMPPFQSVAEEREAYEALDLTPGEEIPVMAPAFVSCRICGKEYQTDVTYLTGEEDGDPASEV
jgi:hypothetical protein